MSRTSRFTGRAATRRALTIAAGLFVGLGSLALAQDDGALAPADAPAPLKHPRGDLWLVLPPGWSGAADAAASRLDLAPSTRTASITVAAFPPGHKDAEIFEAVRDRFSRLASAEGSATAGIAWESSDLAVPAVPGFHVEGRGAAFLRKGHPLRLEVYLLRSEGETFAFAVVADALQFEDERDAIWTILSQARATEAAAAAVASASAARAGTVVELPARDLHVRVPRRFEIGTTDGHVSVRTAARTATLVAAYRPTALEPGSFLESVRSEYEQSIRAQLGVRDTTVSWEPTTVFVAGPRRGVATRLLVSVARPGEPVVRLEQRFYVLPAPEGVVFLTGSAPASSREAGAFDTIAASVCGSGAKR